MKRISPFKNYFISYEKQLNDNNWIQKVEEIKGIYKICQICRTSNNLQVHHTKYIEGRKAWEYENEDLQLVCEKCHTEIHVSEEIPVYDKDGNLKYHTGFENLMVACCRCDGEGIIPRYYHVENGICFLCRGKKYFRVKIT